MIGVDVIDRSCSFNTGKYSLEQYTNRILNPEEKHLCNTWDELDVIWAVKESVYKCYSKITGGEFYNPKKIFIQHIQQHQFMAEVSGSMFNGEFYITTEFVQAISTSININTAQIQTYFSDANNVVVDEFNEDEATQYKAKVQRKFKDRVVINGKTYPYSRAHHGRYYFSAICITPA